MSQSAKAKAMRMAVMQIPAKPMLARRRIATNMKPLGSMLDVGGLLSGFKFCGEVFVVGMRCLSFNQACCKLS